MRQTSRPGKQNLQPVSRPVELVHYFGGWVEGPNKQTDRTDGGWVQCNFGAKAEQKKELAAARLTKRQKKTNEEPKSK